MADPPLQELDRADQLIGTVIAERYKVVSLLGVGSMGAVYLGEHVKSGKRMAVKVLHPSMLGIPEIVARFEREAIAASHLEHPNVATAHDYGRTEDGGFFLTLDYIEGQELSEVIKSGPLPLARALHIARQITSALCLAHDLKIVHRDLKPENIMLTRHEGQQDYVKILDLGLAKLPVDLVMKEGSFMGTGTVSPQVLTKVGALYGTPGYMAPEQALSEAVDSRADLYSLGSILYEMLTGVPPFVGKTVYDLIDHHLTTRLPPMRERAPSVSIPEPVEAIVRRLLAKRAKDRFRDPQELLAALEQLTIPAPTMPPAPMPALPQNTAQPAAEPQTAADAATPAPVPARLPKAARKGTVVALEMAPRTPSSTPGLIQKNLPSPLNKLPPWLLLGVLLLLISIPVLILLASKTH